MRFVRLVIVLAALATLAWETTTYLTASESIIALPPTKTVMVYEPPVEAKIFPFPGGNIPHRETDYTLLSAMRQEALRHFLAQAGITLLAAVGLLYVTYQFKPTTPQP